MRKILILPVLSAVLFGAACGDGGGSTDVETTANVRFFNATTEMTGSGGFTTNGQFATGSALAFSQATSTCAKVEAGSTSIGFGAANAGGTGLSGSALATLNSQTLAAGGNYIVAATGSAASPTLFMFDNNFSGSLGTNQAAVRFVNLVPVTESLATHLNVVKGPFGGEFLGNNMTLGEATTFTTATSGSNEYTILRGKQTVLSGSDATLNFQAGTVNTIAIVQNASGGFQLINIPRC